MNVAFGAVHDHTLTLRRIKDHFVVTGPDIEPTRFKSRPEAVQGSLSRRVAEVLAAGGAGCVEAGDSSPAGPATEGGGNGRGGAANIGSDHRTGRGTEHAARAPGDLPPTRT